MRVFKTDPKPQLMYKDPVSSVSTWLSTLADLPRTARRVYQLLSTGRDQEHSHSLHDFMSNNFIYQPVAGIKVIVFMLARPLLSLDLWSKLFILMPSLSSPGLRESQTCPRSCVYKLGLTVTILELQDDSGEGHREAGFLSKSCLHVLNFISSIAFRSDICLYVSVRIKWDGCWKACTRKHKQKNMYMFVTHSIALQTFHLISTFISTFIC